MSQQQQPIAISNVDSFLGYVLAYRFLQGRRQEQQQQEVRVLARDPQNVQDLERLGAKIIQVDYQNEQRIQRELERVSLLLMIPEDSSNARQEGDVLIRAARQANVQYVGLFSLVGADEAQEKQQRSIRNILELEQQIQQQFRDKHAILRSSLFNQIFYYLDPMIEGRNQLDLPVSQERKWSTVDVRDVADAVYNLSRQNGQRENTFFGTLGNEKRLYQFTGNQTRNGQEIVREWSQALGNGRKIEYKQIQPQELEQYLRGIRDDSRFRNRPDDNNDQDQDDQQRRDRPHSLPLGRFLNNEFIRLLNDIFALADRGKLENSTRDLQQLLGRQPQEIGEYFQNNRDNFNKLR
ncbi:hypothetical protein BDC45DRAFT_435571 [Circinella umbellata]|nr:hypothetical protein BDC45DRAFT_435571 [Circinella umbellata]